MSTLGPPAFPAEHGCRRALPSRDIEIDALYQKILYGLMAVSANFEAARHLLARKFQLSGPQYSMVMAIARHGKDEGISCGALAKLLYVSPAFITNEVAKLVSFGLVEKCRRPGEGRVVRLRVTATARELIDRNRNLLSACNDTTYGGLEKSDLVGLHDVVERLNEGARAALAVARAAERI